MRKLLASIATLALGLSLGAPAFAAAKTVPGQTETARSVKHHRTKSHGHKTHRKGKTRAAKTGRHAAPVAKQ